MFDQIMSKAAYLKWSHFLKQSNVASLSDHWTQLQVTMLLNMSSVTMAGMNIHSQHSNCLDTGMHQHLKSSCQWWSWWPDALLWDFSGGCCADLSNPGWPSSCITVYNCITILWTLHLWVWLLWVCLKRGLMASWRQWSTSHHLWKFDQSSLYIRWPTWNTMNSLDIEQQLK